ncbi:MAG: acetyl-CoA carboxylase carboxyltransferase subunit alpha [Clostridia bacterium]|jgi:acetyl-CoA carboxylase carboxyl transferase subunit alpha|nr:acetyl-CoA carboxylase carboxyltransferase subunit alpha [Clostridia bacterium]MDD3232417.1 acetyl-CoA carboxylase carboxyltransferase subunit alpha [Clostridia bacterium]MDD3862338.1 acetyl-CoA carboxylase carboxyltransferase subunit alpha [Clostridia bacterium]MDD4408900.1 acetyl-CoA carboxylase carboxyltransferase subunit alpha [Clostridia bacterium]
MSISQEDLIWNKVLLARHPKRPTAKALINFLFNNFIELHGDRFFGDDRSIIGGLGLLDKISVTVLAQEKGETTEDKIIRNFGMCHPEGYRKSLRLMKQAEKFNRPIILIIDTPGAYPGIGAEERGQATAIATNLTEMIDLKVPLISIILGEGGSGGALAFGVSDEVWMFENAIYSILSPEGFASILYKDSSLAQKAAAIMKLTSKDLLDYKIIDYIVPEVKNGLQANSNYSFDILKKQLIKKVKELKEVEILTLLDNRYNKYRKIGVSNGIQ